MATALAELAAVSCVVAGAYGSYANSDLKPLAVAVAFTGGFFGARMRLASGAARFQLVAVLVLVRSQGFERVRSRPR